MAEEEEEGKLPVETSGKKEIENESPMEKAEVEHPASAPEKEEGVKEGEGEGEGRIGEGDGEEEKGGGEEGSKEKNQETEEANSDSVTVTVAAASPYAAAVAGVKAEFSVPQLQELEQQTLIYRYMAAAVPVPTHLVFPIWKTVTASSTSTAAPEQYPTLMGLATLCLDFGKSPEPEPGRCRRTDGKKWRCWRNVVPDQKYCERHLHRGRKRPIQAVEIIDDPDDATSSPSVVTVAADEGSKKKAKKVDKGNSGGGDSQVSVEVKSS